jgi:hypothetical protein
LRLPVAGHATARPTGINRALISGAEVALECEYRNVEQVHTP